jgi:hypothetical protein
MSFRLRLSPFSAIFFSFDDDIISELRRHYFRRQLSSITLMISYFTPCMPPISPLFFAAALRCRH